MRVNHTVFTMLPTCMVHRQTMSCSGAGGITVVLNVLK
ncbi:HKR1 isoform 9, partial [Pan troglodytes]